MDFALSEDQRAIAEWLMVGSSDNCSDEADARL